jgi:hypothetical protein
VIASPLSKRSHHNHQERVQTVAPSSRCASGLLGTLWRLQVFNGHFAQEAGRSNDEIRSKGCDALPSSHRDSSNSRFDRISFKLRLVARAQYGSRAIGCRNCDATGEKGPTVSALVRISLSLDSSPNVNVATRSLKIDKAGELQQDVEFH